MRNPALTQQWTRPTTRANKRPTVRARLSGFFNGVSVVGDEAPSTYTRYGKDARVGLDISPGHRTQTCCHSRLRSLTSTRSLIDPSASPQSALSATSPGSLCSDWRSVTGTRCPQAHSSGRPPIPGISRYGFGVSAQQGNGRQSWRKQRCRSLMSLRAVRRRTLRAFALSSIISGFVLGVLLTIYLALTIPNKFRDRGFSICLILVMMILAMIFSYSFIRLCIAMAKRSKPPPMNRLSSEVSEVSFALPGQPIRVICAHDEESEVHEEAILDEETNVQPPPPVYGLWRTSVRVDPDLIHWQRRRQSSLFHGPGNACHQVPPFLAQRPPSYASD